MRSPSAISGIARAARRVAVVAAALGAVAWLAWLLIEPRDGGAAANANAAMPAPSLASAAMRAPAEPIASANEIDPGLVEVCGVGWVEPKGDGAIDAGALARDPKIAAATRALVAELRASPDEYDRATAVVLDESGPAGWLEPLAQQAVVTVDARVYALAYRLCRATPNEGSCARLSAEQWARLDEGNAAPWLFVLADASAHGEREAVDEALYRIGSSRHLSDRLHALVEPIVVRAGTSDPDVMAANLLAWRAVVVTTAIAISDMQGLTSACARAAIADANRRQLCDAAAATLAERSDTAILASVGASLGRRLGWPIDRVVAARTPVLALPAASEADRVSGPALINGGSCERMRKDMAQLERMARLGEVGTAREWLASKPTLVASYSRLAREREDERSQAEAQPALLPAVAAEAATAAPDSASAPMAETAAAPLVKPASVRAADAGSASR